MTITFELNTEEQLKKLKEVAEEIYDYVDIGIEHIPISIDIIDRTITVYIADDFAMYTVNYLFTLFHIAMMRSPSSKIHMIALSQNFREGAEEMLMNDIVL